MDKPTDRWTDGQTDKAGCRQSRVHTTKRKKKEKKFSQSGGFKTVTQLGLLDEDGKENNEVMILSYTIYQLVCVSGRKVKHRKKDLVVFYFTTLSRSTSDFLLRNWFFPF